MYFTYCFNFLKAINNKGKLGGLAIDTRRKYGGGEGGGGSYISLSGNDRRIIFWGEGGGENQRYGIFLGVL